MRPARRALPALLLLPGLARASAWPDKPVRIVIPFAPGGPNEPLNRILAEWLTRRLGQPFVIENRPGATGTVGAQQVMRAAPDGATLLYSANTGMVVAPLLLKSAGYDAARDFTPVAVAQSYGLYIVVGAQLPIRSLDELIAYAKARPDQLNYTTPGTGSVGHLATASFCRLAGIEMQHVSFGGTTAGLLAIIRGDAHVAFDSVGNAQALVEEGKLRGIAVTSAERNPRVPGIPTASELGFPWFPSEVWMGLYAPPGLPEPILRKLSAEVEACLADNDVRGRLQGLGFTPGGGGPGEVTRRILQERPGWVAAMELAGLRQE